MWAGYGAAVVAGTLVGGIAFLLVAIVAGIVLARIDAGPRLDLLGIITGVGLFFFALAALNSSETASALEWGAALTVPSLALYILARR